MGRLALVLGGGAARGAAHLGVIQALEEKGVRPELVAGVSVGAWVGAVFCAFPFREAMQRLEETSRRIQNEVHGQSALAGFFRVRRLFSLSSKRAILERDLGLAGLRFSDLHTPFYLTAVALPEFIRVTIGGKDDPSFLIDPILASSAAHWPYFWKEKFFLDGGLGGHVPVQVAQERGIDFILAVNLGFFFKYQPGWKRYQPWKVIDYFGKRLSRRELVKARAAGAEVHEIHSLRIEAYSVYDFSIPEEIKREGYEAACQILEKIRK